MRQLRYVDFDCPSCGAGCTRFIYFDTETRLPCGEDEVQRCAEPLGEMVDDGDGLGPYPSVYDAATPNQVAVCQGRLVPLEMSGIGYVKGINKNNSDYNERERARLEKRQDDHWRRQGRDEAIDRERAFLKKHGAVGGVK